MAQHAREDQAQAPDLGASVQLDGDPLDAGYVPPDRPYALDEDPAGDTLDDRLQREQGEEPTDPDRSGRITIAGEGAALETPDAMDGVDVGVDGGAAGAEEAAVHEIDDAVIGTGAPVETEPSVADVPALADPELEAVLAAGDPQAERAREQAGRDLDGEAGST
jgi:hypothetical protein